MHLRRRVLDAGSQGFSDRKIWKSAGRQQIWSYIKSFSRSQYPERSYFNILYYFWQRNTVRHEL